MHKKRSKQRKSVTQPAGRECVTRTGPDHLLPSIAVTEVKCALGGRVVNKHSCLALFSFVLPACRGLYLYFRSLRQGGGLARVPERESLLVRREGETLWGNGDGAASLRQFGVELRHPNRLQIALFVVQLERPTVPKVLVLRRKTGVSRPFYGKSATFFCGESAEQDSSRSSRARARGFCYPAGRKTPRGNNGRWPAKGCDGTPAGLIEQLIP